MNPRVAGVAAVMLFTLSGCSTTSSSTAIGPAGPAWEGPVFISQAALPEGIEHKVLGTVQADAKAGYDSVVTLYPLLAVEARKLGANAVVDAKGGRRFTAFSWAAAYVIGTAVKVDDPQKLKGLPGTYH